MDTCKSYALRKVQDPFWEETRVWGDLLRVDSSFRGASPLLCVAVSRVLCACVWYLWRTFHVTGGDATQYAQQARTFTLLAFLPSAGGRFTPPKANVANIQPIHSPTCKVRIEGIYKRLRRERMVLCERESNSGLSKVPVLYDTFRRPDRELQLITSDVGGETVIYLWKITLHTSTDARPQPFPSKLSDRMGAAKPAVCRESRQASLHFFWLNVGVSAGLVRPCGLGQNVADAGAVVRAEGDRELVLVHPSRC